MAISNLPNKGFKVMVIRTFTKLRRMVYKHSEKLRKEKENIRKCQSKVKSTKTEVKNTLERKNRLDDTG